MVLGWFKRIIRWFTHRNQRVISFIVVGLDGAGKSSLLASLTRRDIPGEITPTVGFSSEVIQRGKYQIKLFDLGGGTAFRSIWERYYAEIYGAIFVLDAADHQNMEIAREVFFNAFQNPSLSNKPILVCANKQDLSGAQSVSEVSSQLQLDQFTHPLSVIPTTARAQPPDTGFSNGISWLIQQIDSIFVSMEQRIQKEVSEQREAEKREKDEKIRRVSDLHDEMEIEQNEQKAKRKQETQRRIAEVVKERETSSTNHPPTPIPLDEIQSNSTIDASINTRPTPRKLPSMGTLSLNTPSSPSSLAPSSPSFASGNSGPSDLTNNGKPAQHIVWNSQTGQYETLAKQGAKTPPEVKKENSSPALIIPESPPVGLFMKTKRKTDKTDNSKNDKIDVDPMDDGTIRKQSDLPEPMELREVSQKQFFLSTEWPLRKDVLPSIPSSNSSYSLSPSPSLAPPSRSDFVRSSVTLLPSLRDPSLFVPSPPSPPSSSAPPLWEKMAPLEDLPSTYDTDRDF